MKYVSVLTYNTGTTGKYITTRSIQKAINETALKRQTLVFPPGTYLSGRLSIPSFASIVLAPGAVLKASADLSGFKSADERRSDGFINIIYAVHVRISGLGAIDGNGRVLRDKYGDSGRIRLLYVVHSDNIKVENITLRDPGNWNTHILFSSHVMVDHVKLLNDVALSNTDGFDPDASSHITIQNCFAYCGDDNVAVKLTKTGAGHQSATDIIVKGNIFLTRKSALKVGTESRGRSFSHIVFEDNDVVLCDRGMALYSFDGAFLTTSVLSTTALKKTIPTISRAVFSSR